jgi:hypothetical protein
MCRSKGRQKSTERAGITHPRTPSMCMAASNCRSGHNPSRTSNKLHARQIAHKQHQPTDALGSLASAACSMRNTNYQTTQTEVPLRMAAADNTTQPNLCHRKSHCPPMEQMLRRLTPLSLITHAEPNTPSQGPNTGLKQPVQTPKKLGMEPLTSCSLRA